MLPVIQVEFFLFFFSKKWGDGNGNKQMDRGNIEKEE